MSFEQPLSSSDESDDDGEATPQTAASTAAQSVLERVMASKAVDELDSPLNTDALRYLCGTEPTPLNENELAEAGPGEGLERFIHRAATKATTLLVREIWRLPVERTSQGPVASLPRAVLQLPREKPVPEPKPQTRWE